MLNLQKLNNGLCRRLQRYLKRSEFPSEENVLALFSNRQETEILARIRKNRKVRVAFFCMGIPVWKYETLYRAMLQDPAFEPLLFISPANGLWESRRKTLAEIKKYCQEKGFPYVPLKNEYLNIGQDVSRYAIDVAFYCQPYEKVHCQEYYYDRLKDALLCYVPYGFLISKSRFNYVSLLNRIAWRFYVPTEFSRQSALELGGQADKVVTSGYLGYDMYQVSPLQTWKKQGGKKIIWAPHHSIEQEGWLHTSCFLEISQEMQYWAEKYRSEIQIAFKPHPYLYPALCRAWGIEKASAYYQWWASQENTLLCEGENYPLFRSSDALIHDCGSFLMEYHYTQKPCLYVTLSGKVELDLEPQGQAAWQAHYAANCVEDIEQFIQEVVVKGNDSMQQQRLQILQDYILPLNGKTATLNILDDLKHTLFGTSC